MRRVFHATSGAWGLLAVAVLLRCTNELPTNVKTTALSIELAPTNSGDQQTGTVATTLPNPLRVLVRRGASPAPGVTVRWVASVDTLAASGSLSATSSITDASGITRVSWTLGRVAGRQSAYASISGSNQMTDTLVGFTAVANPGPASGAHFSVGPTNVFAGRPIAPPVQVSVVDVYGNSTDSAATVTLALGVHAGTGILSGTTRVDAVGGVAMFDDLSVDQAGTGYALIASVRGAGDTSLAFDVVTPGAGEIAFMTRRDGNAEIYLMNADGSGQVNLTNNTAFDGMPVWSPDGFKIAFTSDRDGNEEIYAMNADGSGQINLTRSPAHDGEAAWSPDGSKIAFTSSRDGKNQIYVMNTDGSATVRLTTDTSVDRSPAWSPDGSKIAFTSNRDGKNQLYVMNVDGSAIVRLTTDTSDDGSPAWSPDGSTIAFTAGASISSTRVDGSGVTRLTSPTIPNRDSSPRWSPNGTTIVFTRTGRCFHCSPPQSVYLVNADGSHLLSLANQSSSAAWSPTGATLVFTTNRYGNADIYTMNADGSGKINLTHNPSYDDSPTWRPKK